MNGGVAQNFTILGQGCVTTKNMITAAIPVNERPPPPQILAILLCIMCISTKTVCLTGPRKTNHYPKIHIYINDHPKPHQGQ